VCVQQLLVYRAREGEDLTFAKSDPKDAVIIARLAAGLRCYEPERADAVRARLRHLGHKKPTDHTDVGEPGRIGNYARAWLHDHPSIGPRTGKLVSVIFGFTWRRCMMCRCGR
jgi:hypothetical protein